MRARNDPEPHQGDSFIWDIWEPHRKSAKETQFGGSNIPYMCRIADF